MLWLTLCFLFFCLYIIILLYYYLSFIILFREVIPNGFPFQIQYIIVIQNLWTSCFFFLIVQNQYSNDFYIFCTIILEFGIFEHILVTEPPGRSLLEVVSPVQSMVSYILNLIFILFSYFLSKTVNNISSIARALSIVILELFKEIRIKKLKYQPKSYLGYSSYFLVHKI